MDDRTTAELTDQALDLVSTAKKRGADYAEALVSRSRDLSVRVRLGEIERVEEAGSRNAGLRVIVGERTAMATTSDLSLHGLEVLVEDALALAALAEPDPASAPPDASELAQHFVELELVDPSLVDFDAGSAADHAHRAEAAAREADTRITNSDGGSCARSIGSFGFANTAGFSRGEASSIVSVSVQPLADEPDGKKRRASYWDARRFLSDLASPESVGAEAARRTVARLGSRKVDSCQVPVIFDPDAGRALVGAFFGCITGSAVYRRSTYLADREGQDVASPLVTMTDDPLRPRLPGSRSFDGDGLPSRRNVVVDGGRLETFLLDTYSGHKLGRASTGSAGRSLSRPSVSASNFHLAAGSMDPEAIISETKRGLYVTSMMGFGFNPVTGDFSRGAEGHWIENGALAYPVGEITISANFVDLFKGIDAVGTDLDPKTRIAAPTFRVSRMTVSGT